MNKLEFVEKLESDEDFFNHNFDKLGKFYNLRHYDKVYNHIKKHKGLIVLLNELRPCLLKTFPQAKFDLIFHTDPEVSALSHVILYVKVDEYTFDNGVMEEVDRISFDFLPLRRQLDVLGNFSIMPALYNW